MADTNQEIAEAFSQHRFDEALPHLSDGVVWSLVGADALTGPDAVAEACRSTAAELDGTTTRFTQFRTVAAGDTVVVDSVAEYTDASGTTSVVASCDLYDFADGRVTAIRSYNIEVE
jgi:ketosteroid isomerase-like protein